MKADGDVKGAVDCCHRMYCSQMLSDVKQEHDRRV